MDKKNLLYVGVGIALGYFLFSYFEEKKVKESQGKFSSEILLQQQ
jgi:fucose permease